MFACETERERKPTLFTLNCVPLSTNRSGNGFALAYSEPGISTDYWPHNWVV